MEKTVNETVPVATEIVSRLFKIKHGIKLGAIWSILRHVDDGSGALDIDVALPAVERYIGHRNMLEQGDGLFWKLTPRRIVLFSPVRVAENVGLPYPGSHTTLIPVEIFKNHTKTKAAFFCAFLNKISTPISQEKLFEITGCRISSQKRYRKLMGIPHTANIAIYEKNGVPVKYHPELHKFVGETTNCFPVKRNNQLLLAKKLPNTYHKVFLVKSSKRQARGNGRGKIKQAGIKFQSKRVFYGNHEKDNNIPDKSAIKFYRKDHASEYDYEPALFEIFGFYLAPAVRDWVLVLPYDAGIDGTKQPVP